jgi:TniQ
MSKPRRYFAPSQEAARALPFTLAPIPAETTVSFLRRLAAANSVSLAAIIDQIGYGPGEKLREGSDLALNPSAWRRLAVMTGRTPAALTRALRPATPPDSASVAELPALTITTPRERQVVTACRHCTRERGIREEHVEIRLDPVTHLCRRHHVWLREKQFDISILPELTRAQRRHHRLAKLHTADHLANAWTTASRIVDGWRRAPFHPMAVRFRFRQDLLCETTGIDSVPQNATSYPETVHLTELIADARWNAAAGGNRDENERFLREVGHRLETDELHHTGVDDPLLAWLLVKAGHRGHLVPDPHRSSPLLGSAPLHISGWMESAPPRPPRTRARLRRSTKATDDTSG